MPVSIWCFLFYFSRLVDSSSSPVEAVVILAISHIPSFIVLPDRRSSNCSIHLHQKEPWLPFIHCCLGLRFIKLETSFPTCTYSAHIYRRFRPKHTMGCQLSTSSTSSKVDPTFVTSNARKLPTSNGITLDSPQKPMSRSGRSYNTTTTTSVSTSPSTVVPSVSLEVDEEVTYEIPKVDHNGNLLAEEVVRRTSTSLQDTRVVIGGTGKGGKKFRLQVRVGRFLFPY